MARALLVALTFAAVAFASPYADYSGVKMPLYGAEYDSHDAPGPLSAADDYQSRSPDAPAALDYKYEEESNAKTATSEIADADQWQKPARKNRGSMRSGGNDNLDNMGRYSANDNVAPKPKLNHRFSKHRSRFKSKDLSGVDEPHRRTRHGGDRIEFRNRNDYLLDKDEFPDDKSKDYDNDVRHYSRRTTERIKRRKARARAMKAPLDSEILEDDLLFSNKNIEDDPLVDLEYPPDGDRGLRHRPMEQQETRERMRSTIDDDEEIISRPQLEIKSKAKEEYHDYYDMKRLQSLKTKLPELLRRTSTASPSTPTSTHRLLLWNFRRKQENDVVGPQNITRTKPQETTSTTKLSTFKTTTSTIRVQTIQTSSELSLAEKSRLSILKKSMKKDNSKNELSTNKPPVLMLVTKQLPTVVIVEPPTSQDPWMRARLVADDSPEKLDKVKRLMRHKLVAGARNIQDLTSNWDDMVCDYIDTSLLIDSASTFSKHFMLLSLLIHFHFFVL